MTIYYTEIGLHVAIIYYYAEGVCREENLRTKLYICISMIAVVNMNGTANVDYENRNYLWCMVDT